MGSVGDLVYVCGICRGPGVCHSHVHRTTVASCPGVGERPTLFVVVIIIMMLLLYIYFIVITYELVSYCCYYFTCTFHIYY